MNNRSIWFLAVGLVGIIVAGLLMAIPAMLKADNDNGTVSVSEFARIYRDALASPLAKAASETKDPEIASFSQKLLQAYELDKSTPSVNEQSALSDLLPDLVKVNKAALDMPLKEAGKQIKDKGLSEFYDRFIARCGVGK
jgi:hypothetical protein